jgi:nucleoside 2-deoxyribosyltransferase
VKRKLQIFVSSTFTDLREERQAAVAAILKSGHIPAGMELFNSGDRSQLETIKKWIDQSDAYMLILGGRYGSIEPNTGISYTELEYDYAVEQQKPLFSVVIEDEEIKRRVKAHGVDVIERKNQPSLDLFRQKVLSNISSFFTDTKDIKLCIYESLSDIATENPLKGWVSAAELEDTKFLHAQISELKKENEELKKLPSGNRNSQDAPKNGQNNNMQDQNISDMIDTLEAVELEIPSQHSFNGSNKASLLDIFIFYKDTLINGVINRSGVSELQQFLYFNVSPKLMVHGLMENHAIAGVVYRRSQVTKAGMNLLAEIDRRKRKTAP